MCRCPCNCSKFSSNTVHWLQVLGKNFTQLGTEASHWLRPEIKSVVKISFLFLSFLCHKSPDHCPPKRPQWWLLLLELAGQNQQCCVVYKCSVSGHLVDPSKERALNCVASSLHTAFGSRLLGNLKPLLGLFLIRPTGGAEATVKRGGVMGANKDLQHTSSMFHELEATLEGHIGHAHGY